MVCRRGWRTSSSSAFFDSEGKDNAMAAKVVVKGYVVGMVQTNVYFLYREGAK